MKVPTSFILFVVQICLLSCAASSVIPATRIEFLTDSSLNDLLASESHPKPKNHHFEELHDDDRDTGDRVWDTWSGGKEEYNGDQRGKRRRTKQNQAWNMERRLRLGDSDDEKEYRRKKLGRFELENGERFRQVADKGRSRERKWYWDGDDDENDDKGTKVTEGKKPGEVKKRRHRIHEYHHKRRKNFNHIHRAHHDHDDSGRNQDDANRNRRGDHYRRIHHKIWGDPDGKRPARKGKLRRKQSLPASHHDDHHHDDSVGRGGRRRTEKRGDERGWD
ncbi:uncharacterized protein LOC141852864 [Brevipalpus obovatus]|uniref:uncharacterized protein LOC141852864 n=1 Tax=Brevipalpus obovatus TaxID=246614 RepID=UPI003D9F2180